MSGHQDVARHIRELAQSPLATQAATLLRLVSMPNFAEEEIKLLAQLLVDELTGDNALKMLIGALAPMIDNPKIGELIGQILVAMPEDRAKQLFEEMGRRMPLRLRAMRALHRH